MFSKQRIKLSWYGELLMTLDHTVMTSLKGREGGGGIIIK